VIFIKDLLTHLIHRLLDHNVDSAVTEENSSMKRSMDTCPNILTGRSDIRRYDR
jgi:hypothetical protein